MNTTDSDDVKKRRHVQKIAVGLAGGFVLIIGIIAIPYPGPDRLS